MRLLKGNDQSFAFCDRSWSLYHGRNDMDSWAAAVEQIRSGVMPRIELNDLVALPKFLNDIAMSIRDKFIGWFEMLD